MIGNDPLDAAERFALAHQARQQLLRLQDALLIPSTRLDAVALQLKSVCEDLGPRFSHYARWMMCELAGYPDGTLGTVLGVAEDDPLPTRIASYRRHRGQVLLNAGGKLMDLPYQWFFPDSISELEAANIRHEASPADVMITIPGAQIPNADVRQFIMQQTVEGKLVVQFSSSVFQRILGGLRKELVGLVSELTPQARPSCQRCGAFVSSLAISNTRICYRCGKCREYYCSNCGGLFDPHCPNCRSAGGDVINPDASLAR